MSVAVVTGASRGLGRGIAVALAGTGFDVVAGYAKDEAGALETASAVQELGRAAAVVPGDVTDSDTAKALLDAADGLGGVDAWVNNAGVSVLAPVIDMSAEAFALMLSVNVTGCLVGLQAAAHALINGGRAGRIVNVASDLGVLGCRNLGGYAATKFAVVGLTQSAALELAVHDISVNAVCPGMAETDMVLAERESEVKLTGTTPAEVRAAQLAAIPAGRFCTPEDVGGLVAWLCSPAAAYVTGQAICINGGSILH